MPEICVTDKKFTSPIATDKSYMAFMPAVIVAAGIAFLSLTEAGNMPSFQLNDKLVHGVMYLVLALACMGGCAYLKRTRAVFYILVCAVTTLYGGAMEVLQDLCTVTRSADIMDLLADFIGALTGVLLVFFITNSKS